MEKEEFIEGYIDQCNVSSQEEIDLIMSRLVAMKCDCEYDKCPGWAMIENSPRAITTHEALYQ